MDELEIDGKKYLSSKRAAREHKYHTDYIGQLIRAGKVVGKKVGRSWYVEETSLKNYLLTEGGQAPVVHAPAAPAAVEAPAFVGEVPVIHPAFMPSKPSPKAEEYAAPRAVEEAPARAPVFAEPAAHAEQPTIKEERTVYFTSPVIEKKSSTLTYVEEEEPMLPVLKRANADFVAVPMRRISEEPEEAGEAQEVIEEPRITVEARQERTGALPHMRTLAHFN